MNPAVRKIYDRALHDKRKRLEAVNYCQKELHPKPNKRSRSGSDDNKNGIYTEWVIRKPSPKAKPSKTKKYNVSIVQS